MDFVVASRVATSLARRRRSRAASRSPACGCRSSAPSTGLDEDAYDALDEIMGAYKHQLLGNSRDIQGPVLDEVSYWFDEGFPETRERYSEAERAARAGRCSRSSTARAT